MTPIEQAIEALELANLISYSEINSATFAAATAALRAQQNIQNYPEKDISIDHSELIARLREESVHARFGAFDTMIKAANALEGI